MKKLNTSVSRAYEGWSVDPISGWLQQNNETGIAAFSFDTIYCFIAQTSQKGTNCRNISFAIIISVKNVVRELYAPRLKSRIKERQSIFERPQAVNDRPKGIGLKFGHFEADLVPVKNSRPLLVIIEA